MPNERPESDSYVGHCLTCGGIEAARVIHSDPMNGREQTKAEREAETRHNARFVSDLVKHGLTPVRMSTPAVRAAEWCKCNRKAKEPAQLSAFAGM